ncbi:MAG: sensor histidine kinase, partial [Brachybacterium sp.]
MNELGAPRRHRWQEILLLAVVTAEAVLQVVVAASPLDFWRAGLMVVLGLALLLRHRRWQWLLPVLLAVNALSLSVSVLIIVTYAYSTRSHHRLLIFLMAVLAVITGAVPSLLELGLGPRIGLMGLVLIVLVVTASAATGMYTSTRRALLAQLQQRAEQAESGRAVAEDQARRAERTRIAREMHDIVAHKISLVAMHAGALEVNPNLERAQVQQSAGLIRQTATTALSELREVLGVLRGDGEEAPL